VLTYSFVHGDVLTKAGQKTEDSYRITNSISPDLQYYRQTLTPSLLGLIHSNVKQGYDDFAVFEVNKSHPKTDGLTDENVPVEANMIALTVTGKKQQLGAPYYQAKTMLEYVASTLGLNLVYTLVDQNDTSLLVAPFEYRRSAIVSDASGVKLGVVGEYKKSVSRAFKLPDYTAGFEIISDTLRTIVQGLESSYTPLSRYPSSERDICYQVAGEVSYGQVVESAMSVLSDVELETQLSPVDIYQADGEATKNITIRVRLTSHTKTLTASDVSVVVEGMSRKVIQDLGAVVV
jgi:phenylalanyl-tRNA synthetase beta chain